MLILFCLQISKARLANYLISVSSQNEWVSYRFVLIIILPV